MNDLIVEVILEPPLIVEVQLNQIGATPGRFINLTDVDETTFVGHAGEMVRVNVAENKLEFGVGAYTLLPASATVLGGVKKGDRISIDANGVISAEVQSGHTQGTDQGLDTGGANAVTAAQVKGAVTSSHASGSDAETIATIGAILNGAGVDTLLDADTFNFWDAVDSLLKKITWANIKSVFALANHNHSGTYQPTGSYEVTTNKETSALDTSTTKYPNNAVVKNAVDGKQATLQSGTNIKTVGGISLLGSGDLPVNAGIWTALTGAYASTVTFTFTGTGTDVNLIQFSLFTCTSSDGNTRRIGYIKSSVNASGTITVTVVTDTNLAAGDINFKVAYNRKVDDYIHIISIPGEVIADSSYSQGVWRQNLKADSYLLPVDFSVLTAAAGAGAACTMNIYKNTTALFSSAPDMGTNAVLVEQRPTTNTLSAAENISLRIMSSAGATNKAADFQAKLYIVPQLIFSA